MPAPSPTKSDTACAIVWFRDDLRIADNPALDAAMRRGLPVIAVYVLDETSHGIRLLGGAARWWLHHSLERLGESLKALGVPLVLRRGAALAVLGDLAGSSGAVAVAWNRRYGAAEIAVDTAVKAALTKSGVEVESFAGHLLHEPWTLKPASGPHYKVFTAFWKAARVSAEPRRPLPAPKALQPIDRDISSDTLDDWRLLPRQPDWSGGLADAWTPGEAGARDRLDRFLDESLTGYTRLRDRPDHVATSMLSPHLRFGEISPFQVWHSALARGDDSGVDKFLSEIGWREFSWHLLFHNPGLTNSNLNRTFDRFAWRDDTDGLDAWRRGRTGFPIVDAGMRQLWTTGWMHNRVRMIAASFLIKNLMIDWRQGEAWFWDTLVDADAANNPASWQWVAGSGADAAPFFRIFNPVLQGRKFDPQGAYVRHWIPEIADLSDAHVHEPWKAPDFSDCGYPAPIVDHAVARYRALDAFKALKR
jgi:deoxyribodipyrimidine photo-lyase